MMYALLPFIFAVFWTGLNAVQSTQNANSTPPATQIIANTSGQSFYAYRNAVLTYSIAHPATTGNIATGSLTLPPGALPSGIGNNIATSGNGRIVYAWATLPPNVVNTLVQGLQGDPSIGTVNGTQWISPVYGPQTVTVPNYVPNGAALSIQKIGN